MVVTDDFGCRNMVVTDDFWCRTMVVPDDFWCRNMVVPDDFWCRNMVVSDDFEGSNMVVTYDLCGSNLVVVVTCRNMFVNTQYVNNMDGHNRSSSRHAHYFRGKMGFPIVPTTPLVPPRFCGLLSCLLAHLLALTLGKRASLFNMAKR
jgi:hypothetical protein